MVTRMSLRMTPKFQRRVAVLKCNAFSYKRVGSGDKRGADRLSTPFAEALVKQFEVAGFKPKVRIEHTGTIPLLKHLHFWSWQNVVLDSGVRFKRFRFTPTTDSDTYKLQSTMRPA